MEKSPQANNPLHGITLEKILNQLVDAYGWEGLSYHIQINCFHSNPSIQSSLKFLRKTPWARTKVENFYLFSVRKNRIVLPTKAVLPATPGTTHDAKENKPEA